MSSERFYDLYITAAALVVTPSDITEFPSPKTLYVGSGGNVAVVMFDDDDAVTMVTVPDGSFLPIAVKKVMSTNTTASNILALSTKK